MAQHQTPFSFAYERWRSAMGGVAGFACLVLLPASIGGFSGLGQPGVNIGAGLLYAAVGAIAGPLAYFLWNLLIAPYSLLRQSRAHGDELEARLKPIMRLSPTIASVIESVRGPDGTGVEAAARAVRIKVESLTDTYVTGNAFLVGMQVSRDDGRIFDSVDISTPIQLSGHIHASKAVLSTFEFMRAHADNTLTWSGGGWPLHLKDTFATPGVFRLALAVSWWDKDEVAYVEVRWTGQMSTLTCDQITGFE